MGSGTEWYRCRPQPFLSDCLPHSMCAPGAGLTLQCRLLDERQKACKWIWIWNESTLVKSAVKRSEDEERTPLQTAIHETPGFGLATAKVGGQPGLPLKPERKTTLESGLARGWQRYCTEVALAVFYLTNLNEHTDVKDSSDDDDGGCWMMEVLNLKHVDRKTRYCCLFCIQHEHSKVLIWTAENSDPEEIMFRIRRIKQPSTDLSGTGCSPSYDLHRFRRKPQESRWNNTLIILSRSWHRLLQIN